MISKKFILLSYLEGLFYALMVATSESFALFISIKNGLTPMEVATVSTLPLLVGAFAQWAMPFFISDRSVRPTILICMFIQLLGVLGLFIFAKFIPNFYLLLSAICLYWIGGLVVAPLWLDWCSSHIPYLQFRSFLSTRSGFVTFCTLPFYLITAYVFNHFTNWDISLIFVIGFSARFISMSLQFYISYRMNLPRFSHAPEENETAPNTVDPQTSHHFLTKILPIFILWTGIFKFAVYISTPFFVPYMIEDLNFTIWDYSLVTGSALFGRSIFMTFWGKISFGLMPFMTLPITGFFISFIPFLWILSSHFGYLSSLEFGSGILWGGFELCCILIIQNVISESPRRYLGLHMAVMNLFSVGGSFLGGWIVGLGYSYLNLFFISSASRLTVVLCFFYLMLKWPFLRINFTKIREQYSQMFRAQIKIRFPK